IDYLAALRVRGDVLDIGEEELRFTSREIYQLFRERYSLVLENEEAAILADETQGWAIALQLIWRGLPEGALATLADVLKRFFSQKGDLFTYLAREVLAQQPPDVQSFLKQTSVLRQMTAPLCDCLLGTSGSEAVLRFLLESGLFVTELEDGTFQYHRLFNEFLYTRLTEAERRAAHSRAADCYEATGSLEEAIHHRLNAGESSSAANLITRIGGRMIRLGLLNRLDTWIHQLDPQDFVDQPILLIYLGDIDRLQSRFDEALVWYQQAEDHFRRKHEPQGICEALRGRARIYLDTVNPARADRLLREALRISDGHDNREMQASLMDLLAENQLNRGHPQEAERLRTQAWELRQEGPSAGELEVRVLLRTGQLAEAQRRLLEQVAAERDNPVFHPRAQRETLLLLSFIEGCLGNADAAYRYALEGTERGDRLGSPFVTAVGCMRQAHALQLRDDEAVLPRARSLYEQAIAISDEVAVDRLKVEAYFGLCRIQALQGELKQALYLAEQGVRIARQAGDEWIVGLIYLTLASIHMATAHYTEAARWLDEAYLSFTRTMDTYNEAVTRLWKSLLLYRTGDTIHLRYMMADLLDLVRKHGYEFVFMQRVLSGPRSPRELIPLLLFAREEGINAAYVDHLLRSLGLEHLTHHPGYQLRVHLLGAFQVFRGEERLSQSDWQRDKARHLFQFLLTRRDVLLEKERILDAMWPDLSPRSANQHFKVSLNALYHALEPDRVPGSPSAYIVREGNRYGIREGADMVVDVDVFTQRVAEADDLVTHDPDAALARYQQALDVYQGEYLHEFTYDAAWYREERERLHSMYLRTADRVAQMLAEREQWERVLAVCGQMLQQDDCWERAYRLMMRAHVALGNRPHAIKVYQRLVERLKTELDTVPSEQTTALFETIR
ncbi:MAG: BTAD domain-containing putative transcriptional regulator, partial [Anaerolineae bacterium]